MVQISRICNMLCYRFGRNVGWDGGVAIGIVGIQTVDELGYS